MIYTDIPVAQLRPNPDNPRKELRDIEDLAASVAQVGVLQPLVVERRDGDSYLIHMGHRRHAAAEQAGLEAVPCLIGDSPDQVRAIVQMLSENLHRDDLTVSERAAGFAQLELLGLDAAAIAKVTAVARPQVEQALALARLPQKAHEVADSGALNLDDAAALADLPDDVAAKILGKKQLGPWGMRHEIHAAQASLARKEAIAARTAELTAAGVPVIKKPGNYPYGREVEARTLQDGQGAWLDPEQVKTLPGFAAFIDCPTGSTEPRTVIVCLDPEAGGYTRTTYTQYKPPQEIAQEQAEREAAEARKAALTAAGEVRWQFVERTYGSAKAAKTLWLTVLRAAVSDPDTIRIQDTDRTRLNALAGVPAGTDLQHAGLDRVARLLVCRYLVALETNLADVVNRVRWRAEPQRAADWLDLLVNAGYSLSDVEAELRDTLAEELADQDGDEVLGGEDDEDGDDQGDVDGDDQVDEDPDQVDVGDGEVLGGEDDEDLTDHDAEGTGQPEADGPGTGGDDGAGEPVEAAA